MKRALTLLLFGATLASGVISVQALSLKPKASPVCGSSCSLHPRIFCGRVCSFCDVSLGDGNNQGICTAP